MDRHFSAFKDDIAALYGFSNGYRFLDLTLGDGGHTEKALNAGCQVVSFDVDPVSIDRAKKMIPRSDHFLKTGQWKIINANFIDVQKEIEKNKMENFDGIMVDLGPSQPQVLDPKRGFSFESDEELDMRIDPDLAVKASDLLQVLNEGELRQLFEVADEPFSSALARIICKLRTSKPITTCRQLSEIVKRVKRNTSKSIHPATQVFMALRMAVNLERDNIRQLLPQLPKLVKPNGKIGVITLHSGEDIIVKNYMETISSLGDFSVISSKPLTPSQAELQTSKRTRSAKLRIIKKNN